MWMIVKRSVAVLLMASSVYVLVILYQWWSCYPTSMVRVAGEYAHTEQSHVSEVLMAQIQQHGFWRLPLVKLQSALKTLPWVKDARITRRWPGVIDVELNEYQPVARWGQFSLLDPQGQMFSPKKLPDSVLTLPYLLGLKGQHSEILAQYQQFSSILQPIGVKIARLEATEQESWVVQLSNGLKIYVDQEKPGVPLKRFADVYDAILGPHAVHAKRVDLRYANGLAVAWRHNEKPKG